MTPPFHVLVPGKLVIVGEYAVLDGAGAVVAAVDRGVGCEVDEGEGIEVPGGDDRFVRAALEGAPTRRYRFFDWNPPGLPEKAGFGGSAAATVAATLAAGFPGERAFEVHRRVQGGAVEGSAEAPPAGLRQAGGSGVDVFASLHGGVRRFPEGAVVGCPPLIAVWSGRAASTGPRVARYRGWVGREGFVEASRALVARFEAEPLAVVEEAYARLREMAAAAGVDYDTGAHREVARLARLHGGAAKPSGAGGGDVAVALFPDEGRLADFARACAAAGLVDIRVRVSGPAGARAGRHPGG